MEQLQPRSLQTQTKLAEFI